MSSKSILVTGGAGYIGSHVVLALLEAGWNPVVVDDFSTGTRHVIPESVPVIEGRAGDFGLISKIIKGYDCTGVMHFAGYIIVPESVQQPLRYYRNNLIESHYLIDACIGSGIEAFVFSSTAAVYGHPEVLPVSEYAPLRPINPYGWTKMMTEQILIDTSNVSDMRHACLRYFNVAGADSAGRSGQISRNSTHLIKIGCEAALGLREKVIVFGDDYSTLDGTCLRDFIHVSDLANVHVLTLERLLNSKQDLILNCGYGHGFSVREVLETISKIASVDLLIECGARRAGDPPELISDSKKIRSTLNWAPKYDNLEIIARTALNWEKRLADDHT